MRARALVVSFALLALPSIAAAPAEGEAATPVVDVTFVASGATDAPESRTACGPSCLAVSPAIACWLIEAVSDEGCFEACFNTCSETGLQGYQNHCGICECTCKPPKR